jgi:hypothetical protein
MAQPGGRICGLPSRYRTYLRCSPLLCAADSLSIIVQLLTNIIYLRLPVWKGLGVLLRERFSDAQANHSRTLEDLAAEIDGKEAECIQSLEKTIWHRWLWFILGTLPP